MKTGLVMALAFPVLVYDSAFSKTRRRGNAPSGIRGRWTMWPQIPLSLPQLVIFLNVGMQLASKQKLYFIVLDFVSDMASTWVNFLASSEPLAAFLESWVGSVWSGKAALLWGFCLQTLEQTHRRECVCLKQQPSVVAPYHQMTLLILYMWRHLVLLLSPPPLSLSTLCAAGLFMSPVTRLKRTVRSPLPLSLSLSLPPLLFVSEIKSQFFKTSYNWGKLALAHTLQ